MITNTKVIVWFKTGIKETYYLSRPVMKRRGNNSFDLTDDMTTIGDPIKIYPAYLTGPIASSDALKHHVAINRDDFEAGSFIDKRIVMHRFLRHVVEYTKSTTVYPMRMLYDDWDKTKNAETDRYVEGDVINFYPRGAAQAFWRHVSEYFFNSNNKVRNYLWWGISRLCEKKTTAITTEDAVKTANWVRRKKTFNPVAYAALLKQMGAKSVIDLHPGFGHKALACAILDIEYFAPNRGNFAVALDNNICGVTSLKYSELNGQSADLLISDSNFNRFDISKTAEHSARVNRMVAYAPRSKRFELQSEHNPSSVVKVMTTPVKATDPNFLFIW